MLPGAVLGMLLLFGYLLIHGRVDEPLNQAAGGLLNYLPLVVAALFASGLDYPTYRQGAAPIALLLGPATVALAVPLYLNLKRIRLLVLPALCSLVLGRQASSAETRVAEPAGA